MAKTIIFDVESKNHVPFLRGILARSLNESGLSFKVAYELATEIRQELSHVDKITSLELNDLRHSRRFISLRPQRAFHCAQGALYT